MTDELLKTVLLNQVIILSGLAQLVPAGRPLEEIVEQIRHTKSIIDLADERSDAKH